MKRHALSPDDRKFQSAFEACTLAPSQLSHEAHVRLAYAYLVEHDVASAVQRMRDGLLKFLDHHAIPRSKFHETITRAWVLAVQHFMQKSPSTSADDFIAKNPELLDSKIMLTHYSASVLFSPDARASFVAPDLDPIPEHGKRPMRIAIGSDHAGYRYKTLIAAHLAGLGHTVEDFGTHSVEPVDYPSFIRPVAEAVGSGAAERGIVLGGSGNGEAMVANRVRGVRCALCWNEESARLGRAHNDANVLSLGERFLTPEQALAIVDVWLTTEFAGGRHLRRIEQIDGGRLQDPSR